MVATESNALPVSVSRDERRPVMIVTRYDVVTASLIAVGVALLLTAVTLILFWLTNRLDNSAAVDAVHVEYLPEFVTFGSASDVFEVQSPDDAADDPSIACANADDPAIDDVVRAITNDYDQAKHMLLARNDRDAVGSEQQHVATGTGDRPLGSVGTSAVVPREQRWIVSFADSGSLTSYARQLDFFGIELGVVLPDARLIYLSDVSTIPKHRIATSGRDETRLFMSWQGGDRIAADREFFKRIDIDASQGVVLHFYSQETEAVLAQLELAYAGRPQSEIRRTWFQVRPVGNGFEFAVTRQAYTR